ncbi:Stage V sporulation protein D [Candidatus Xiphinematobacter sp. Idaho Grape]|uniref:penicillin-binding protein 2 n=1 Tax=Candidatus Xiphinematobacter sp. Idaho Grape TaxID=1704307 RepID=UPI0007064512|nr:penicillin-binding protein 2 [Candidatus Xiphinematobacter sp. Idaho Grape]ALJ56803.1 Stage V sporulation protein D [Candidatus Xiphinematobacter sp. Idaho Grape]
MNRKRTKLRLYFLAAIILLALGAVTTKLWYIQIIKSADYRARTDARSKLTIRIPAVRGEIRDRNGIPLVQNRASFDMDFYLPAVVRAYKQIYGHPPQISHRAAIGNMIKDLTEDDIVAVVKQMLIFRLEDLGLMHSFNFDKLQTHYRGSVEIPFHYRRDIDFDTVACLSENNATLPGVTVAMQPIRRYVYGAMAAHVLGYVGMPRHINRKEASKFSFFQPDIEGKSQIELYANEWLKGTPGIRVLRSKIRGGVAEEEVSTIVPKRGSDVYLTIDARIQYISEKAMRAVGRGAAVVVDPNSGDVLAMVSVPSFDPNKFIPAISARDWNTLIADPTNPLINRSIGAYAPGSVYKIVTALAGLSKRLGHKPFTCTGGIQYGNKYMQCWVVQKHLRSHGILTLSEALEVSCNAFFYQYGNATGIDQIVQTGSMLGLGQKTGIPLAGESSGLLPTPGWLSTLNPAERWSTGYTANTSIGQGFVLTTPLQMALLTATIANGGITYYPRLIDRVVSPNDCIVTREPTKVIRTNLLDKNGGIRPEDFELVRDGLWRVVNSKRGTGGKVRVQNVSVAGKSGTAQFWRDHIKDNRVWFVAFAPFEKPKYAVCVMVEGAQSGGSVAAPIVKKILGDILAMENGKEPHLTALSPAKGDFSQIESVDFEDTLPSVGAKTIENEGVAKTLVTPGLHAAGSKATQATQPDISG